MLNLCQNQDNKSKYCPKVYKMTPIMRFGRNVTDKPGQSLIDDSLQKGLEQPMSLKTFKYVT